MNTVPDPSVARPQTLASLPAGLRRHFMAMNSVLAILRAGTTSASHQAGLAHLQTLHDQLARALLPSQDAPDIHHEIAEPMLLSHALQEVAQALALMCRQAKRPVVVDAAIDPATELRVMAQRHRLQQVLMYLGESALRVSEHGTLRLEARVTELKSTRVSVEFSLEDTGPGLEAGRRETVLQGTGGLALTAALVAQMGGQLQLHSEPGQGCRLRFALSLQRVPPDAPGKEADPAERRTRGPDRRRAERRLAGLRVLVVEDNPINQVVVDGLLSREGANVTLADNGQLGVEALAAEPGAFDAVLMDLQMPVMDGYAATRCIRTQLGLRDLPVIAVTSNQGPGDRSTAMAAGMNEYLGKPFEIDTLVATLLALTGHRVALPPRAPADTPVPPEGADKLPAAAVDEATALARLGGNQAMFLQVLQRFMRDLVRPAQELSGLLRTGDRVQAARLLHTLKGLAATVGANPLSRTASELEQRILSESVLDHATLVQELQQALERTSQALEPVLEKYARLQAQQASPAVPALVQSELAAALRALKMLLQSSDMGALQAYAGLRGAFSQAMGPHVALMDQALADLDFPMAIRHCEALLSTLPD